jgi:predicted PhzF superfamily epimerase YddE/YHI9
LTRRFFTLDVFTETPPAGNPLGFVVEGGALRSASIGGSAVIVSIGALDL